MANSQTTGLLTAVLMIGLSAVPARADNVDSKLDYATISGTLSIHKDLLRWDLYIRDPKPNNRGVYALVRPDISVGPGVPAPDIVESRSKNTSGGKTRRFGTQNWKVNNTRGAKVFLCEDRPGSSDWCRQVAYVEEQ